MCFPSPIGTAEAFAAGRGKPQGCGLRVRKAGCRISPDPKPDAISRGDREAAVTSGGAGVARGAAASPPGTFAKDHAVWGNPLLANGTIPPNPPGHAAKTNATIPKTHPLRPPAPPWGAKKSSRLMTGATRVLQMKMKTQGRTAIASISIFTSFGKRATSTQERAGKLALCSKKKPL